MKEGDGTVPGPPVASSVQVFKGCLNFRDREVIYFKDLREVVRRALTMVK